MFLAIATIAIVGLVATGSVFLFNANPGKSSTSTTAQSIIPSSSTVASHCVRSGEGWAFYVRVVADQSGTPISGAKVSAVATTTCQASANSTRMLTSSGELVSVTTPDNGTVSLPTTVDEYSITVDYQGAHYSLSAFVPPVVITTATLSVPSGNVTIANTPPSQ